MIEEQGLPNIPRLGGFHLLKSFLGLIGYLMKGSGLEDCIKLLYPDQIVFGNAYYKALRAHFMINASLCTYLLHEKLTIEEIMLVEDLIENCKDEKSLGCYAPSDVMHHQMLSKKLERK